MSKAARKQSFAEWARSFGPMPDVSMLAVPGEWTFVPEECDTEYLIGFLEGLYDSMNEHDPVKAAHERTMARAELKRRGVEVTE